MLDQIFVRRKLKFIAEDLKHLEDFSDYTLDDLAKDYMKHAAVERLLERIVVRATDINNHLIAEIGQGVEKVRGYGDSFLQLAEFGLYSQGVAQKLADDAKFRNVLVHEYNNIDKLLVYKKIKEVLDDFHKYGQHIITFLEKQQ